MSQKVTNMKGTSAQTLLEKIKGLQKTETQIILNYVNYFASWKEIETVYSWIKDLDEENRALFLIDLVKTVQTVQQTADISELKDLVESWEATAEILGDRALKKSLEREKQEIAKGKWIQWENMKDYI